MRYGSLKKRAANLDAGLAKLEKEARFGQPLTAQEIATVCHVSPQAIAKREAAALRKLKATHPEVLKELLEAASSL